MRIGITGHQRLSDPSGWDWVKSEMLALVQASPRPLIAVSSLAVGADQLFAQIVLQDGGTLEAIIPFEDYENTLTAGADKSSYRSLLNSSSKVEFLPKSHSDEESYLNAGKRVVDLCELLVAVWDGKPAAGLGGTGDVVNYAQQIQRKVVHLNPSTRKVVEAVDP
jgi:hypothetical protein